MKIRITEMEATAEELKATRSLAESFTYAIQRAIEPVSRDYDKEETADIGGEEQ